MEFKISADEPQKVSEGKAGGTVKVAVVNEKAKVEVSVQYKGPNRRIDAYLSIEKGGTVVKSDIPYTLEFRQGGGMLRTERQSGI